MAVLYETIRLWPGLPKNARYALADDCLPAIPEKKLPEVTIYKGDYILWSDRLIMRDPEVGQLNSNGKWPSFLLSGTLLY